MREQSSALLGCYRNNTYSYHWQEERAHVTHRLILHAGHEIDIVERLEISVDERSLLYEQELYSGGRFVKRKEEFPATGGAGHQDVLVTVEHVCFHCIGYLAKVRMFRVASPPESSFPAVP